MLVTVSGVIPEEPVISRKSGHLFEKRLVSKYIEENGTCPVTGEALSTEDLIAVKSQSAQQQQQQDASSSNGPQTVKQPRAVIAASIPGMLQMFQNEWDALMLETYTLKQHLDTVRQELSHALYQHDAACRVIARLMKERDEARTALANAKANMEVEQLGLTQDVIKKMSQTSERLSTKRKKRKISTTLAAPEFISALHSISSHPLHKTSTPGITCLDVNPSNHNLILTGGMDQDAILFHKETGKILSVLSGHSKQVNDILFHPTLDVVFSASADRTARLWTLNEKGEYKTGHTFKTHHDEVTGISLQSSGDYIATCSLDKTWGFFDITTGACLVQSDPADSENSGYTAISFHPDGLIFGTGTTNNDIKIWDIKSQENVATFKAHTGKVTSLSFSENGYVCCYCE